jgi:hypothetical protein
MNPAGGIQSCVKQWKDLYARSTPQASSTASQQQYQDGRKAEGTELRL